MRLIKKMFMLGFIIVIGIIALAVIGTAISGDDTQETSEQSAETNTSTETEPAAEETPEEEPLPGIGEEVELNGVVFKVNGKSTAQNLGGEYGVDANGTFLILDVSVTNNKNEPITTDTNNFKLLANGNEYTPDSMGSTYANENADFFLQQVNPGITVNGNVAFDVPPEVADSNELILQAAEGIWGTETTQINLSE